MSCPSYAAALTNTLHTDTAAVPVVPVATPAVAATVFADLCTSYPTWSALRDFLRSDEGGKLNVYEVPDSPHLAMIRYVKSVSVMELPHVGAFRSVVWNTESNCPVSVTAWKSETGEGLPDMTSLPADAIHVEDFIDGVMIGQFYDSVTESWRIHTRSTLDAQCRYYSKTHTFADLFNQIAVTEDIPALLERVPKEMMFTWILTHPENRIVCPVHKPRLSLVGCMRRVDSTVVAEPVPASLVCFKPTQFQPGRLIEGFPGMGVNIADMIRSTVSLYGSLHSQGIVVTLKDQPFRRWKLRSPVYNEVRKLRGNSARLDFLWMSLWSHGALEDYLKFYPEERREAQAVVNRWKEVTQTAYNMYVEVFKARSCARDAIPAKIKPLVLGLHQEYLNVLRPAKKSLDWRAAVQYMNARDTAQKIYVLNWDLRQESQHRRDMLEHDSVPVEPNAHNTQPTYPQSESQS